MVSDRRVTGIGGVFFKARDPKALAAWYASHLGVPVQAGSYAVFQWRDDPSATGTTVWAVFDEGSDYLGHPGQRVMVNFRVADLDAVLATLRREGVRVDDRVEETAEGRFGWITDPEENRVELWQPPAGR